MTAEPDRVPSARDDNEKCDVCMGQPLRCQQCGAYLTIEEVDGQDGHCRSDADSDGDEVAVHCGPVDWYCPNWRSHRAAARAEGVAEGIEKVARWHEDKREWAEAEQIRDAFSEGLRAASQETRTEGENCPTCDSELRGSPKEVWTGSRDEPPLTWDPENARHVRDGWWVCCDAFHDFRQQQAKTEGET